MNTSIKKKIALAATTALVAVGLVSVSSSAYAAPVCATANYVESCGGVTADGAKYAMMAPANFNGTVFIYSHGYRYAVEAPALGYSLATVQNNPVPAPLPNNDPKDQTVIKYLLSQGYGIAGSTFKVQGWNANSAVATDEELISTFKTKFPTTKKVIGWGESLGGFITQALAEKNPTLLSAAGLACPALGTVEAELNGANDFLWGMKTFFDKDIKGHNYSAGDTGTAEAMKDISKILGIAAEVKASLTTGTWPHNSGSAGVALAAIPPRSALLLIGLIAGLPLKSAHFDGTTGPGSKLTSAYTSFALAASPALAVLENGAQAAILAVLATLDMERQSGGPFYDNSTTDYAARVADDVQTYNAALSGNTAIAGMLAFLNPANPAAPRWTATTAAKAEYAKQVKNSGTVNVPTITLTATSDPIVPAGNTQWLADQYAAQYAAAKAKAAAAAVSTGKYVAPKSMFLPIWNHAPVSYTKFDSAGSPDTSGAAATGTNHCNFTSKQWIGLADALVIASTNGNVTPTLEMRTAARKAGGVVDTTFVAPLLPFYRK
jgi:pimeloyl-ACP methyl ester carboxylesterase